MKTATTRIGARSASAATAKKVRRGKTPTVWKDEFYVEVYKLAKAGLNDTMICEALGTSLIVFSGWKKKHPALLKAVEDGRSAPESKSTASFLDYVYEQLPPRLKKVWKRINRYESEVNGYRRIQALLANEGEDVQKHLFLHALVAANFSQTKACKKLLMPMKQLKKWVDEDMGFANLLLEIDVHKKDFFESKLIELVNEKDPAIVWNVNKSVNRDRGYGDKTVVEHTGAVSHNHQMLDISILPFKLQRMVLDALDHKQREEENTLVLEHQVN